jgi:hypothetical protein
LFGVIAFGAVERAKFKSCRPRRGARKLHARTAFWAAELLNCKQWDCGWVICHCIPPCLRRLYFGGCSSLLSQPVACSVFRGSGPSQSKHWGLRCPLPSGGSARNKSAPQLGQVGRLAWPMGRILPPVPTFVKPNQARINLGLWKCSRFERNGPSVGGTLNAALTTEEPFGIAAHIMDGPRSLG